MNNNSVSSALRLIGVDSHSPDHTLVLTMHLAGVVSRPTDTLADHTPLADHDTNEIIIHDLIHTAHIPIPLRAHGVDEAEEFVLVGADHNLRHNAAQAVREVLVFTIIYILNTHFKEPIGILGTTPCDLYPVNLGCFFLWAVITLVIFACSFTHIGA
ncbi:hypothetical protein C8R47DRAFT_1217998 [Mycena vitilis]|nr:hypothetical protein C8R47DRAFT_1217998 [Mycena vitilis]